MQTREPKKEDRWITSDGKAHVDSVLARAHQRKLDFFAWCDENICRGGEWSSRMVATEIWQNWDPKPLDKPRSWDE